MYVKFLSVFSLPSHKVIGVCFKICQKCAAVEREIYCTDKCEFVCVHTVLYITLQLFLP